MQLDRNSSHKPGMNLSDFFNFVFKHCLNIWNRLYEAQLSFNHGLKPRLISALLNRVVRSSIIF